MTQQTHSPASPAGQPLAITALVALCVSLVSIASAAIFIKFSEREISPYATAFNRFWITSLVLAAWNGIRSFRKPAQPESPKPSPYSKAVIWELICAGLFLSADLMLWAYSLTQTTIANATLFANLTPIFTCLGSWLVWRRRVDGRFLIGLAVAVVGIGVIGINDLQASTGRVEGDCIALLAAISFGVYLLFLERLQTHLDSGTIVLWSSTIAAVLSFPIVLIGGGSLFPTTALGWLMAVALALICQVMGQGLLVHSMEQLSAEFVALFLLLEPVVAAVGAWAFFAEQLSWLSLIAFAIVLAGISLALNSPSAMKHDEVEPSELTEVLTVDGKILQPSDAAG